MSGRATALFLVSGAGLLTYFYFEKKEIEKQRNKSINQGIGKPRVGGPFRLVDHHGTVVTEKTYQGKFMLLYFGYTFCPDVCPEELEKMAKIYDLLMEMGVKEKEIAPLFVSCDPKRDSIDSISAYVKEFHPKFVGLTGTYNQIKSMAKTYRLYFSAPPRALDEDETDYLVDHSIFFYLMGPDGEFVEHYGRNDTAEEIAQKIFVHYKK